VSERTGDDSNGNKRNERLDHYVSVGKTGIRVVDADQATLERAAVQRLRAGSAHIENSSVGVARFEHGTVTRANVGAIVGKSVAVDETRTLILASPVVRGEVHTLIDLRTAVAIGFGMALGRAILSLLGRK
jgi:hypothetical protein